jgi:hypothetical protein
MAKQKCAWCAQKHDTDEEVAPGYCSRRCLSEDPEAASVIERIKNARAQATLVQSIMLLIVIGFVLAAVMD